MGQTKGRRPQRTGDETAPPPHTHLAPGLGLRFLEAAFGSWRHALATHLDATSWRWHATRRRSIALAALQPRITAGFSRWAPRSQCGSARTRSTQPRGAVLPCLVRWQGARPQRGLCRRDQPTAQGQVGRQDALAPPLTRPRRPQAPTHTRVTGRTSRSGWSTAPWMRCTTTHRTQNTTRGQRSRLRAFACPWSCTRWQTLTTVRSCLHGACWGMVKVKVCTAAAGWGMVWYGVVEVCEGAPVAVSGWVLTDRHDARPCAASSLHRETMSVSNVSGGHGNTRHSVGQ